MKQVVKPTLLRKILILSFVLMALGFLISSGQQPRTVHAAPCCSQCLPDYDLCMANARGSSTQEQICWNRLDSCNHHCVSCGGGGTGPACYWDWDCTSIGYSHCNFDYVTGSGLCE